MQMRTYFRPHRGRQWSRWSFNVAPDGLLSPLLKGCSHMWPRPSPNVVWVIESQMHPQCVRGAFLPVLKAVHLWLDHSGRMLLPGGNRAYDPASLHLPRSHVFYKTLPQKKPLLNLYHNTNYRSFSKYVRLPRNDVIYLIIMYFVTAWLFLVFWYCMLVFFALALQFPVCFGKFN